MNREAYIEWLVKSSGIWSIHLGRTTLWVLLGISCLVLFLRCLLVRLYPERLGLPAKNSLSTIKLNLALALLLSGICVSVFFIIKPDSQFLTYLAEKAISNQDYEEAVYAYEPLAKWGTDRVDVYNKLAISYFNLGRYREAIDSFHRAQTMEPQISTQNLILCARAHERIGEPAIAIEHLKKALSSAQSAEEQTEIRLELDSLMRNYSTAIQTR